jgi:hypothetical protein
MIDQTRRKILEELLELSELTPDVRFGQLIVNLSYLAIGPNVESTWEVEDEDLLAAIRQHSAELASRHMAVA